MASKRRNPVARVGNYMQDVDTMGMDPEMKGTMMGTKMEKHESAYVRGAKNKASATEAVRRTRRANKRPPLRESE